MAFTDNCKFATLDEWINQLIIASTGKQSHLELDASMYHVVLSFVFDSTTAYIDSDRLVIGDALHDDNFVTLLINDNYTCAIDTDTEGRLIYYITDMDTSLMIFINN